METAYNQDRRKNDKAAEFEERQEELHEEALPETAKKGSCLLQKQPAHTLGVDTNYVVYL